MRTAETDITLKKHIVRTLLYYDIFNYPLKSSEVFQFLGVNSVSEPDVLVALNSLVEERVVFRCEDFYGVQFADSTTQRRKKGNLAADGFYELARKKASLIAKFPFVRAVMASGSLSKGYMDEKSDLDFFIVTAPGRLWIARTLLVMYKRIFLLNSHKYFCVNYFVDEHHLEIEEKNLFTATELATALPLYGAQYYKKLIALNPWLKGFFPNYTPRPTNAVPEYTLRGTKNFLEQFIHLLPVDKLESFFRKITLNRWKRLYAKEYPTVDFEVAFKSREYASKNHPQNFQRKIMELYAKKIAECHFVSFQLNALSENLTQGLEK